MLLINLGDEDFAVTRGMRIAQIVFAAVTQAVVEERTSPAVRRAVPAGSGRLAPPDAWPENWLSSIATGSWSTPRTSPIDASPNG